MSGYSLGDTSVKTTLKYGLNPAAKKKGLGGKPKKGPLKPALAAFAEDSDDEDGKDERERANAEVLRQQQAAKSAVKAAELQKQALQADATIFDYDGHFDGFQDTRKQKVKDQDEERVERKSRYIESLMAKQKERDREQDIIYERRLLKERVKEDHLYGDKDKFVTASYRKKLEEDRKWLEEEKIADAKEAAEDVAKKGDLSGFYHNLMSRNTAAGAVADKGRAAPEPPKEDEATLAKKREQERRDAEGAKRRAAYEQLKALEEAEAKKIEEEANRRADPSAPEKRHKPTGPPGGGLEIRRHPAEVEAEERANAERAAARAAAADAAAEELSKQTLQEQRKAKADDAKARYLARKKAAAASAP